MDTKKEEYIDKMAAQLKEWSKKIDELETRVNDTSDDVKAAYESRIRELKEKREALSSQLRGLRDTSGEAWVSVRDGMDTAWKDLKNAFAAARSKFKKAA